MNVSTRGLLAMLALLLAFANQFMALALTAVDSDILKQFNTLSTLVYLGLAVGALVLPLGIRKLYGSTDSGIGKNRGLGLLLIAVIIFTAPIAKLSGYDSLVSHRDLRFLMLFGIGLMAAPSFHLFFSQIPKHRHGFAFGLATGFGLTVCHFSIPVIGGGDGMEKLPFLYDVHSLVLVFHAVLLLILFTKSGSALFLPPPLAEGQERLAGDERSVLLRLIAALCMVYILIGALNGILFRAAPDRENLQLHFLSFAAIFCCPIFGLVLDKYREQAFHIIMPFCAFLFILSPTLFLTECYGKVFHTLLSLGTLSYYAFYVTMTCVLAGMARSWWFCLAAAAPSFLRIISIAEDFLPARFGAMDQGISVLLALLSAVAFYLLMKSIRLRPRDVAPPPVEDGYEEKVETVADVRTLLRISCPALSPRESEVAEWIVKGAGTREIAEHLAISENTVKVHVKNILEKYNLPSRKAFIAHMISRRHGPPSQSA